jgi:hypothetical protein
MQAHGANAGNHDWVPRPANARYRDLQPRAVASCSDERDVALALANVRAERSNFAVRSAGIASLDGRRRQDCRSTSVGSMTSAMTGVIAICSGHSAVPAAASSESSPACGHERCR